MSLSIFTDDMIFIHPKIQQNNQKSVIQYLCSKMVEKGIVTEAYFDQVIAREKIHPTGLPTLPIASAVPHADPIGVNRTAIALAVLEQPVTFFAMDNPLKELNVSIVFLMSFIKGDQIAVLRWVSNVLGDQNTVRKIAQSTSAQSAFQAIEPFLHNK
jgi:PTS system galactitol-specific IIA component